VSKKAGHYRPDVCRLMSQEFAHAGIELGFHYIENHEELEREISRATEAGCRNFLAAGGDGTVSLVASCLYGKQHRLGIIPVGTGNCLARVLGISLTAGGATKIAVNSQKTLAVDGMEVNGRIYLINVSAGLSSISLDCLKEKEKAIMGMASYIFGVARASFKVSPVDYELAIDGKTCSTRAVEIHVTNTGVLGIPQYRIHDTSCLDDGQVEVVELSDLSPITVTDAVLDGFVRHEKKAIRCLGVGSEITIRSREPQPVQGDGDIIGLTPIQITVRPRAINFIVP